MDERLADRVVSAGAALLGVGFLAAAIARLTAPVGLTIAGSAAVRAPAAAIETAKPSAPPVRSHRRTANRRPIAAPPTRLANHRALRKPPVLATRIPRTASHPVVVTYAIPAQVVAAPLHPFRNRRRSARLARPADSRRRGVAAAPEPPVGYDSQPDIAGSTVETDPIPVDFPTALQPTAPFIPRRRGR